MSQSILLTGLLYAFVSVATILLINEFGSRGAARRPGSDFGMVAFGLGGACFGAALGARGIDFESLAEMAIVLGAFVAVAYAGFFLDGAAVDIPIVALGLVLLASIIHQTWSAVFGALMGLPFIIGMLAPERRVESIRDGTVTALGGAVLGPEYGIGAAVLGSFVAFIVAFGRRKGKEAPPVPRFAPYIATAAGLAVTASALIQPA